MSVKKPTIKLTIYKNEKSILSFFGNSTDRLSIVLSVPRKLGITKISASITSESFFKWTKSEYGVDLFSLSLNDFLDTSISHFEFYFTLYNGEKKYYLDNESKRLFESGSIYTPTQDLNRRTTHIFIGTDYDTPPLIKGAIYQIFIDRFKKKDPYTRNDSRYNSDWENGIPEFSAFPGDFLENNTHFGGNFKGIEESLDYLESLFVDCIYLSPVYKAYSNHKYDVGDYLTPDENFGGEEKLKSLIQACKKRGIRVILDSVFNHTGDNSIYFNKFNSYNSLGAYQSTESEYYSWYTFNSHPDEYESWWGVKCLPSIKKGQENFIDFVCRENGVIDYYAKMGIDGLRLDVADELTIDFIKKIKSAFKRNNPLGIIVGEVWENAVRKIAYEEKKQYFDKDRLDSVTNYPLMKAIIEFVKNKDADDLNKTLSDIYTDYPYNNSLLLFNSLSTHDTYRAISAIGANPPSSKSERSRYRMSKAEYTLALKKFKLAVTMQTFLPGIPCIYYGDEIGMQGLEDPFNRMPMQWHNINKELFEWHKTIMKIRKNNRPLYEGGLEIKMCKNGVFAFDRYTSEERVRVIINLSGREIRSKNNGFDLIGQKEFNKETIENDDCAVILIN